MILKGGCKASFGNWGGDLHTSPSLYIHIIYTQINV